VGEPYDLVFLGPDGAVLIRLVIDTGKQTIADTRRDYAAVVFRSLDADSTSALEPAEAVKIPVNGQLSANAPPLGDGWKALDFNPADNTISADELATFVDQQLGPRVRVTLKTRLQQSVRLTGPLDANGDALVSRDEIEAGLGTLHVNDFDDDGTLSVAELQPYPTAMRQAIQRQEAEAAMDVPLLVIMTDADRSLAAERMLTFYGATDGASTERRIPCARIGGLAAEAVTQHDRDTDGALNGEELAALLAGDMPRLTIGVQVQRSRVQTPEVASLALVEGVAKRYPTEPLPLRLAGMPVKVRASSNREGRYSDSEAVMDLAGIQFQQVDADNNDYLDATEFMQLRGMLQQIPLPDVEFAGIDVDGDGMVRLDEVKNYAQTNAALTEATLVVTVSDDAKTLFEILDGNLDNRLSPREFQEGFARMRKYDHDKDGRFGMSEMRSEYGFVVSRSRPQLLLSTRANAAMAAPGVPRPTASTAGPTWFRKMDRNQDNDVAWREFLGPRADFDRIDSDQNALIDLNEATAVD
jgi:Ca2+-binding EF-hand superfamily protein